MSRSEEVLERGEDKWVVLPTPWKRKMNSLIRHMRRDCLMSTVIKERMDGKKEERENIPINKLN